MKADVEQARDDGKMKRKEYEKELRKLQAELCRLQEWVKHKGRAVIIVFEGRDAAGKGGTIKALTERVSPRVFRVVALPAPSDREKTQMSSSATSSTSRRPARSSIFDRSWYNRAGVEHVMGFCSEEQYERFLELCPLRRGDTSSSDGIQLIKIWLEVGQDEQERRFAARIDDPLRQWKLSPMDVESWHALVRVLAGARRMLKATDSKHAPWYIVRSDDKRRARLNGISHILSLIPLQESAAREGQAAQARDRRAIRRSGEPQGTKFRARTLLICARIDGRRNAVR